jgi:F0F1-type ATP synthase epsilon subunit
VLQPGALTVKEGATTTVYYVSGGFVEAGPTVVRVLADAAEAQADIDTAQAQKRIGEAEAVLKSMEPSDPRADVQRQAIRRERRRLEVAGLK